LPWLPIIAARRNLPKKFDLPGGGLLENLDTDTPLLREIVNWKPGQHSLSANNLKSPHVWRSDWTRRVALYLVIVYLQFVFEIFSTATISSVVDVVI